MNNQQSSSCLWSRRILSSTILASFIIFATIAYSVYSLFQNDETTRWVSIAASIILSVLWLLAALQTPRSVEVSAEQVRIKLPLNSIRIHRDEISKIEHYPLGMASMRIVGMGHFFGNVGLFYSEVCGRYYSLVTNEQDIVLIYRYTKKPIAVSVADQTIFSIIASIEKR